MAISSSVNVEAAIEGLDRLASFAAALQDARTVLDALVDANRALKEIDREIASKRAELDKLRDTELATVKAEAEHQRDAILTSAREQATKLLKDARQERDSIGGETTAMKEKRDKLRREIENIQATVARLAG